MEQKSEYLNGLLDWTVLFFFTKKMKSRLLSKQYIFYFNI